MGGGKFWHTSLSFRQVSRTQPHTTPTTIGYDLHPPLSARRIPKNPDYKIKRQTRPRRNLENADENGMAFVECHPVFRRASFGFIWFHLVSSRPEMDSSGFTWIRQPRNGFIWFRNGFVKPVLDSSGFEMDSSAPKWIHLVSKWIRQPAPTNRILSKHAPKWFHLVPKWIRQPRNGFIWFRNGFVKPVLDSFGF